MQLSDLEVQSYILYRPDFVHPLDRSTYTVTLERRVQREGADKWGIFQGNSVLHKKEKQFGYEGMPSGRSDKNLKNTRFISAEEGFKFWKEKVEPKFDQDLHELVATFNARKNKEVQN